MAHKKSSVVEIKTEICNEPLSENTDLQHIKEEDCNETCAYQENCAAVYVKEGLENNILAADHLQHRADESINSIESITNNFHNKEEFFIRKNETFKTEVNDDLSLNYSVEDFDCKVEIKEELKNNIALANELISCNIKNTDLTWAEKGDMQILAIESHLTIANTIVNKPTNANISQQAELNNMDREGNTDDVCNKVTRNKSYVCDLCHKTFKSPSHLTQHMRTHTGEKPFFCDVCNKSFNTSSYLRIHKRTHTGETPYACGVCDKKFNQSYTLAIHKRTHTGEKPHVCDVCNKAFNRSSGLVRHTRTHTGDKPYACDVCNKIFINLPF